MSELKELYIVGAGGFGRELLQWVKDINAVQEKWIIKGFLDDNLNALDEYVCDYKVVGKILDYTPKENEELALGIAEPHIKEKLVKMLMDKGAKFATVIHPSARICEFCEYGEGLVMYPNSAIGPNCKVGNYVTLLSSGLGHDAEVDDFVTICSYCGVSGHVKIGKRSFIASHVVLPPSKKVGEDAYVGAGSVVVRNVRAGKKVFGNPAREIDL
jgi:sugar O-acyltransferase (sialic acid O-acetyltransferase NeuD family)